MPSVDDLLSMIQGMYNPGYWTYRGRRYATEPQVTYWMGPEERPQFHAGGVQGLEGFDQNDAMDWAIRLQIAQMQNALGQQQLTQQGQQFGQRLGLDRDIFNWNQQRFGQEFGEQQRQNRRQFGLGLASPLLSWELNRSRMPTAGQIAAARRWITGGA